MVDDKKRGPKPETGQTKSELVAVRLDPLDLARLDALVERRAHLLRSAGKDPGRSTRSSALVWAIRTTEQWTARREWADEVAMVAGSERLETLLTNWNEYQLAGLKRAAETLEEINRRPGPARREGTKEDR